VSFQENITVALSQAELVGAKAIATDVDEQGNYWTVVMLTKDSTEQIIVNQQESAKRLAGPAMAAFNAQDRMDAAFDKIFNSELTINSGN
jgi:hypothetical protein